MRAPDQPRGGHALTRHQNGDATVKISIGHLDRMPRCKRCGKAICSHTDAEFSGHPA